MKIWLLEGGERQGPFESFDVRERVSKGELGVETLAWYEGAEGWCALSEVPSLSSAFSKVKEGDLDLVVDIQGDDSVLVLKRAEGLVQPLRLHPVQRLFARMVDVLIYCMVVMLVMAHDGVDLLEPDLTPVGVFLYHSPYVLIDALFMHLLGTTIGKSFLGIRVTNSEGGRLSLLSSLLRSARVWVIGLGMFTILMPVTFLISWLISRRYGKFLWDLPQGIRVERRSLKPLRVIAAVIVVWSVSTLVYANLPEDQRTKIEEFYQQQKRASK